MRHTPTHSDCVLSFSAAHLKGVQRIDTLTMSAGFKLIKDDTNHKRRAGYGLNLSLGCVFRESSVQPNQPKTEQVICALKNVFQL